MDKPEKDDFLDLLEDFVLDSEDKLIVATKMRSSYQDLLSQKPLESPEYGRLISCAMETGHYESAILICKEAIKNFPNQGPFYLSHSICLVQLGRTEEAVKVIEEGLTRDPEFAKTHKKEDPSEPEGFLN